MICAHTNFVSKYHVLDQASMQLQAKGGGGGFFFTRGGSIFNLMRVAYICTIQIHVYRATQNAYGPVDPPS